MPGPTTSQKPAPSPLPPRLQVQVLIGPEHSTLADDVREGLRRPQKALPPKHFYDDAGSTLFDRICDTPEYYPTRTEQGLLESVAARVIATARPDDLVELGSGSARKTRTLLDAAGRAHRHLRYVPLDVSEGMLRHSAGELLRSYPWLRVHGIVGDYDRHLAALPRGSPRLLIFLGGTVGNFDEIGAVRFLSRIAREMGPDDHLLLGTDLVKDRGLLHAAYNDAQGLTAEFNRNVLRVVNRELHADFQPEAFEHVAFFHEGRSQIEMYLRASRAMKVHVRDLGMTVSLDRHETIHTEISRKFTRDSVEALLQASGLSLVDWYTPENRWFGLSLSRKLR